MNFYGHGIKFPFIIAEVCRMRLAQSKTANMFVLAHVVSFGIVVVLKYLSRLPKELACVMVEITTISV